MSGNSSLLQQHLQRLQGKRVVLVMDDQRAFKGTVGAFDDGWLELLDVSEGSTVNSRGWEEVTIHTGFVSKRFTEQGVFAEQDAGEVVRLKDTLINLSEVLRLWEWEPANLARPKHTKVEFRRTVF